MEDKVNIAVIGAGYWGKKVIREYMQLAREIPEASLSMVCDVMNENLAHCSDVLQVPQDSLANDYKQALSSEEINAIHICTPNETHYKICKEALLADKNVLLEKPMALKAAQAWELVGLAKSRHLCLQVGHIFRFNNALKMIRDRLTQQYLGQIYYLKLQWTTLMASPLGRDIIFDLGPHPVDILNYLLDAWPARVSCTGRAFRREHLEEVAYMTLEFEDKRMANVELSWLEPGQKREVTIVGSERSALVDCTAQKIRIFENGDGESFNLDVESNNTILDETTHFVERILDGEKSKNGGPVGARNVEVLEKAKQSLTQGRTLSVSFRDVT